MATKNRIRRRFNQLLNLILVASMVLPAAPAAALVQDEPPPTRQGRGAVAADPFDDAVPVPLSLPSGLEFNTFDGSLSLRGEEITIPHGDLPLSFSMSWDSDKGWTPKWKIYFVETRYLLSGGSGKKNSSARYSSSGIRSGVTFYLEDRGSVIFGLNSSGGYDGPEGYTVTDTGGDHPAYTLRTLEGTVYYFDNPNHRHVTKIENAAGQYLQFTYVPSSSTATLTRIADTYGRWLSFTHNDRGQITLVTDANSSPAKKLAYTYDSYGRLISTTDPLGNITQYSSADKLLCQITNPLGTVTTIQYVSSILNDQKHGELDRSRAVQVSTPTGSYHFAYEFVGPLSAWPAVTEMTSVRQIGIGQEAITTYEYLGGLPVKITNAEGGIETLIWNSDRRMTAITDENNHTTSFEYDDRGNRIAITNPLSQTMRYTYESNFNKISSITDPNGNVTTFTYDTFGHLLTQTDPLSQTIHFDWAGGRLESITDPLNQTTHFGFDEYGYPTVVTDTLGYGWTRTFDARGTLTSRTDPNGDTYTFTSDAMDRLTKNSDPLGHSYSGIYDALGNPVKITDPNGNIARYLYDAAGRPTAIVDPHGGTTMLTYDGLGNLSSVMDPAGSSTSFGYDKLGRMTVETDSLGQTMTYTYDEAGNITSRTDAQGRTSTYLYDAANRMTGVDYPSSGDVTYEYDPAGRLINESNGDVEMNYSYDAIGQLLGIHIEPFGKVISYTYDAAGRRETMIDPDGGLTTYSYDAIGQLESMTDPQNRITNFVWDPSGRLIGQEFASGAVVSSTLDAVGQVLEQWSIAPGGGSLLSREYTYDAAGNRLSATNQDGETTTYTYDALSQLTGAAYSAGGSISYTYDAAGDRTSHTDSSGLTAYTYDSANRLLSMGSTTYTHDEDGNRTGMVDGSESVSYTYNEENLLTTIQPAGGQSVTFSYYPDGRRLSRTDASGTTYYFYDNYNVLLESNASGVTTARYTSWSLDRWITLDRGGQSYDYLQDSLLSTIGLLDSTGNLAAAYEYKPFGELQSTSGSVTNPYLFAGRRHEDGWYYNRMRMYDPVSGRFAVEDPAGMPDGPNRYLYALNNPTTYIDPFGLACGTPSSFGECHAACMKYLNPVPVQMASALFGALGTGATRKATDLSSKLLAGSTAKDWLAAAHKPKEPWWSAGISSLVGIAGTVLAKTQILGQVLAAGVVAGPTAIAGAALVGWGAGTFVGCSISCAADRDSYNFAIKCDRYKSSSEEELPELPKPPDDPGGDHPDENYSAASPLAPDLGSPVYRDQPYIGLLWRGYAEETGSLINQSGELYERVDVGFNPALLETLPVLVIPSGGLYGLETSGSFRARLADYVEAGGTIVSFAQQQGIQFTALPVPESGDTLGGYGWREDSSCFRTSLYLSDYHQMLSGFNKPTLDAHVDGYFTSLPDGTTSLLNRMKNGQPGLLYYRYPAPDQGGYVLATSIYDDWGGRNRQISQDARVLIRDILSWAYDPEEALVELKPGQLLDLPIEVVNDSSQGASQIEFIVRRPDRSTAYTTIVDLAVPANGTVLTDFSWPTPGSAQLGIWWIEYALLDSVGAVLQDQAAGGRFVISDPSPITGPGRDLFMAITSPYNEYPIDSVGEFTFHVYNTSDTSRDVEIHYGLPHHTWESQDLSYGNFNDLIHAMSVPAQSEATFVYTPTLFTTDTVWASLMEDGQLRDKAHFSVFHVPSPQITTMVAVEHELYAPGSEVIVTTVQENLENIPFEGYTNVKFLDPSGVIVGQPGFASSIEAQGTLTSVITYTLPVDAPDGFYTVQAETTSDDVDDVATAHFEVGAYAVRVAVSHPPYYLPNSDNTVSFTLENIGIDDISTGMFTVTMKDPANAIIYSDAQPFAVDVGQSVQLDFNTSATNDFGTYQLEYMAAYHGYTNSKSLAVPNSNIVAFSPANGPHQAGKTTEMQFDITNNGRFQELPDVRLEFPSAAYSQTISAGVLLPGETVPAVFDVPLPVSLTTGSYPVTVTLSLSSGSMRSWALVFFIPPSHLEFATPPAAAAGEIMTLTLSNTGGATTDAGYDLILRDGIIIQEITGTVPGLHAGTTHPITVTLDPATSSGYYFVIGDVQDAATGATSHIHSPLEVTGTEASLAAQTNQRTYLAGAPITATATITSTGTALSGATLSLKVLSPVEQEQWGLHEEGDHGLLHPANSTIFVDSFGQKWFGLVFESAVSVMNDNGTPLDPVDDVWQTFQADGDDDLKYIEDFAEDSQGNIWSVNTYSEYGLRVLDYNGTLTDLTDDRWQTFGTADGLGIQYATGILLEDSNLVWVTTEGDFSGGSGLSLLDHNGTPFDKSDDTWQTFTTDDGLASYTVDIVVEDETGIKWIGTNSGVNVLDDGGTPLIKTDDLWYTYTNNLSGWWRNIFPKGGGIIWFGSSGGIAVLDHKGTPMDESDDEYTYWTSIPVEPWSIGSASDMDSNGYLWITSGGYSDHISVLDDNETPHDKNDDLWVTWDSDDGISFRYQSMLSTESGRYIWTGAGEGVTLLDHSGTLTDTVDDAVRIFDHGLELSDNDNKSITVDSANRKWFGGQKNPLFLGDMDGGLSVLDDNGTPLDLHDDTWQVFTTDDGLLHETVNHIAVDYNGYKWMESETQGVSVLDDAGTPFFKDDDAWQTYTSADNALFSNGVRHIAVDAFGNKWFGTPSALAVLDEGVLADKGDDVWQTFDDLWPSCAYGIIIDDQGIIWISCGGWLTAMNDGGTPFDPDDDSYQNFQVSVFDDITDFAIDEMGNKWSLLYDEYTPEGVRVLDDGGTPFDPADDVWQSFTTADGLVSGKLTSIVIDEDGRKWFGTDGTGISVLDDGGTLFDKSDDSWRTILLGDQSWLNSIMAMAVDHDGTAFIGTKRSGVHVVASTGATIWESNTAVDLEYGLGIEPGVVSQVITSVHPIASSGKYYLEAELLSTNGQRIAKDVSTFYIFDADTGLTMESDKDLYRPGQEIILTGQVSNGSGAPLTGQTLTITQDGETIFTDGPFDVPAGGSHPYTTTTAAPMSPGSIEFHASLDGITLDDKVEVVVPQVLASIEGPGLVGSEPFTVTVILDNGGQIDGFVGVTMGGATEDIAIPAGEIRIVQRAFQIDEDTAISAVLTGDLDQTLEHAVEYGLSAEVAFLPEVDYCAGLSEIPFTITNTGRLDVAFATYVTFSHSTAGPSYAQIDAQLPVSGTLQASLAHELLAGDYTMDWLHPFGSSQESFTVQGFDFASMEVITGPVTGTIAPITVTVINLGCNDFGGFLAAEARSAGEPFYGTDKPLDVPVGGSDVVTLSVDTFGLAPGPFAVRLDLVTADRTTLQTITTTGTILGPAIELTALPTQTVLHAGETADLSFMVENQGQTGEQVELRFGLDDLEDETQRKWIGAGENTLFTFSFFLPPDLPASDYLAAYTLSSESAPSIAVGEILFPVQGISLTVDAATDQAIYLEGDPVIVSLTVGNAGGGETGDLTALVSFNGITQTQAFSISQGAATQLDFPLTVTFEEDHIVFYGIYYGETDRSIYLNTIHLRRQHPAVTIVTDKQVYRPGETVAASLVTTLTQGTLTVYVPGFEGEVPIASKSSFEFTLPQVMARGTYYIEYTTSGSSTPEDGRQRTTLFDVDGPVVYARKAVLTSVPDAPGGAAVMELTVSSDREVDASLVGWIEYPDGSTSTEVSQTSHLLPVLNNGLVLTITADAPQMGQYAFYFEIVQEGDGDRVSLAKGSQLFDLGGAALDAMTTDQPSYPNADDAVEVSLRIFGAAGGAAEAQVILDQGPPTSWPLTLTPGFQTVTATLNAPIPPGRRTLTATLTSGAFEATATTTFDYGTDLADLLPGAPWLVPSGEDTRVLSAVMMNYGGSASAATYAHFYDGDPALGGSLIGTSIVPVLASGQMTTTSVIWSILGQGGDHTLYVTIDAVVEFDARNNSAYSYISLPRFDTTLIISPDAVEVGQNVHVEVRPQNLQGSSALPITATLQIRAPNATLVHSQTWHVTMGPGETWDLNAVWSVDLQAVPGRYAVVSEVWDGYGAFRLVSGTVVVSSIQSTDRKVYIPLLRK